MFRPAVALAPFGVISVPASGTDIVVAATALVLLRACNHWLVSVRTSSDIILCRSVPSALASPGAVLVGLHRQVVGPRPVRYCMFIQCGVLPLEKMK